jgi:hypothetical protein
MVMEMMDTVMEIMALMTIMTNKQQNKVDIRGNQDFLLTIWLNQKTPNIARVSKTASQVFSVYDTSKSKENQNKEEKKDDCPIRQVRCVYQLCQNILKNTELPNIGTELFFL